MLDLQLYSKSIPNATLTSLDIAGDSTKIVQSRPTPRLVGAAVVGTADAQRAKLDAPGLPNIGMFIPVPENELMLYPDFRLKQKDTLDPQGYQDSGGAAVFTLALLLAYGRKFPIANGKNATAIIFDITDGTAAWGTVVDSSGLDASKTYQMINYYNIGTDGLVIRFLHPNFDGLRPGGPAKGTDVLQNKLIAFPKDDVPQFKGDNPIQCQGFGAGNANKIIATLIEL